MAIREYHFDEADFGRLLAYAMVVGAVLAMPIGAILVRRLGGVMAAIASFAGFAALALTLAQLGRDGGPDWLFAMLTFGWVLLDLLTSICLNPLRLQHSDPTVGATQFAAYTSASNIAKPLGALMTGAAFGAGAETWLFWVVVALFFPLAILIGTISREPVSG